MTSTDQHALREALARVLDPEKWKSFDAVQCWPDNTVKSVVMNWPDSSLRMADTLIAGPLAPYLAAEADMKAAEAHADALNEKLVVLAPHGTCACSYDQPGDVCAHHSPALLAAEAENTRLKETVEAARAALKPFAEAWDSVEDISEQGAGYVQDTDDAWVSGNASGGSYPLFKFGDLRAARSVLATIPPKENPDA